ncbi:universal stress protein UspA-like protein [Desulfosporosinus orientis DSM 765]|uniref:Universal stress protein UspA-like protein n=1 Tax=Desulfosporosinus orientis (strain ATCC 19365 / DSM 765 / NCIMB 8382 / VKM B-1628 / Singapore I) TaxID=768706 RepID=G7W612_DESOD|nr:universal stress protein [Desulfosporosinus orientis]AET67388.1 universal stress protein UspA-like protein [Desulfosporosinus orientis DSM 765]
MTNSNALKVLLYADGSPHSLSAAVYAASLFSNLPDMQLTILSVEESVSGAIEREYNLLETWSSNHSSVWMGHVMNKEGTQEEAEYSEILTVTNKIFARRGYNVNRQIIYANYNIPDITKAIIDYAAKKHFGLIIMGTRGLSNLKGLIYGSLAHNVLNKSDIPVMLIKKLPQDFIDEYCCLGDEE